MPSEPHWNRLSYRIETCCVLQLLARVVTEYIEAEKVLGTRLNLERKLAAAREAAQISVEARQLEFKTLQELEELAERRLHVKGQLLVAWRSESVFNADKLWRKMEDLRLAREKLKGTLRVCQVVGAKLEQHRATADSLEKEFELTKSKIGTKALFETINYMQVRP
jgi:hypothetical protein